MLPKFLKKLAKQSLVKVGALPGKPVKTYTKELVPEFKITHAPKFFTRRTDDFTANICGIIGKNTLSIKYRLNGSDWREIRHTYPRVPDDLFTIECSPADLIVGKNLVEISVTTKSNSNKIHQIYFNYTDASPVLPLTKNWKHDDLDASDGYWERFQANGQYRVRPAPGFEDYDRIIIVCGAFSQGRRVTTDVIFHAPSQPGVPYGFGVLPLWGGRPDNEGETPRRGWNFSIGWYYTHYESVGMEFSYKLADASPDWIAAYKNFQPKPGEKYHIVIEAQSVMDNNNNHLYFQQRMQWYRANEPGKDIWMTMTDEDGSPLPPGDYGVGLIGHRCQVDFGEVMVEELPPIIKE